MNQTLFDLQQKCFRAKKLEKMLNELMQSKNQLTEQITVLKKQLEKENKDVERLERGSLASWFYTNFGNMEEKRSKEMKEAREAAVKYDNAVYSLDAVNADIERYTREQESLRGCEAVFASALKERVEELKGASSEKAAKIREIENKISSLQAERKECEEACTAGFAVLNDINQIEKSLSSANGWGTWDLLGGGFLTDLMKYSSLDEAQKQIEELQVKLRRFQTELSDVRLILEADVKIDGFIRFADYFFDDIFSSFSTLGRIDQAREKIEQTKKQVNLLLAKLSEKEAFGETMEQQLTQQLTEYVIN